MEIFLIVLGIFFVGMGLFLWQGYRQDKALHKRIRETKKTLENGGFTVVDGLVNSPSVIVKIREYANFVETCKKIDATTIYQNFNNFYAFTADWQVAYRLNVR